MKLTFFVFVLFCLLFINLNSKALPFLNDNPKNVIKVNPISPFFGKLTVGYERRFLGIGTLEALVGIPVERSAPSILKEAYPKDLGITSSHFKGTMGMLSYKLYLSLKGAPRGFYIAPYAKYEQYSLTANGNYKNNSALPIDFDVTYKGYGGGVQLGMQWLLFKHVSLELYLIGLEAKLASIKAKITDVSGAAPINELYNNLKDAAHDVPVIGKEIEVTQGSNYVEAKVSNKFLPGYRAGFTVGIAF